MAVLGSDQGNRMSRLHQLHLDQSQMKATDPYESWRSAPPVLPALRSKIGLTYVCGNT